jgi:hypothetical protein
MQQYVRALQVLVNNSFIMAVRDCSKYLVEGAGQPRLRQAGASALGSKYCVCDLSSTAVLHDQYVIVHCEDADDVRVVKIPHDHTFLGGSHLRGRHPLYRTPIVGDHVSHPVN